MNQLRLFLSIVILVVVFTACTQSSNLPLASQVFSTNSPDFAYDVAAQGSNVYVVGATLGSLKGPSQGYSDAFIRKYNPTYRWGKQFGGLARAYDVAVDSLGNSYVAGEMHVGNINIERGVVFLHKYDPNGALQWTRQFGSFAFFSSSEADVAVDHNDNVYLASSEIPANSVSVNFVRKLGPSGNVLRKIQIQPLSTGGLPYPRALDIDSQGNIYVLADVAYPEVVPDTRDTYILRYNPSGTLTQSQRVIPAPLSPSEKEFGFDLEIDQEDYVLVSVSTGSFLSSGYLIKYRGSDLLQRWLRKPSRFASIQSIAIEGTTIYIAGSINSKLPGVPSSGAGDAFVMKYDSLGSRVWVNQFASTAASDPDFGTSGVDIAYGVAVSDAVYVVGSTTGRLLSTTAKLNRDEDAFIAQLNKTTGVINWLDQ